MDEDEVDEDIEWEEDFGFTVINPHDQVNDFEGTTFEEQ